MATKPQEVFENAVDLVGAEREAYIRGACGADRALRAEVDGLFRAFEKGAGFLASPTVAHPAPTGAVATMAAPLREGPGTRIGPYKLLQLIGEGGFGSVFMAEQEKPVSRKVALKIIKLGMDTRAVIARFEAERQALAMMDHPNIARVLDAGATETGRPFFVMELVKGDPIVEYCDKNNLSIEDRLELFAQVCNAVQHAHTKGIIHRDIKPSNILVSTQDGRPHTKVIDFGIAKATASKLTEKTLFTEHRALIGTPEYMSPEQAEGSMDIDTRTDVYSLGVLLYELLTGTTPFSSNELRSAAYAEIQRIIREVEPPKPSTRISHNTDTIASVAARRHTEPKRLGAVVRGELDWIVMKALEKDRQRRYETANGLAMDIGRYLSGEVVLAAPPSTAYQMRKFLRRHRAQVAAAALVAVALLLGLAGTAWQAKVASDRAEAAKRAEGEAKTARDAEKARADELKKVSDFQASMLAQVNATTAGMRLTEDVNRRVVAALEKARIPDAERAGLADEFRNGWARVNATEAAAALIDTTILKPAVKAIDRQFKDQPVLDAQLRQTLADRYFGLGLYDAALPLQTQALDTRRRVLKEEHKDTIYSTFAMSKLLQAQIKFAEAEPYSREALEKRRRVLGEEHQDTLRSMDDLGWVLWSQRKYAEAEPYHLEALEKRRRVLGEEHPNTLSSIVAMGVLLRDEGKPAEAEVYLREAVEKYRRMPGNAPAAVSAIADLGFALLHQNKFAEAEPYLRDVLEKHRRLLGEDHPYTLMDLHNVGDALEGQGKFAEAEACHREILEKRRRVPGERHSDTILAIENVGRLLQAQGKLAEAEQYYREAVEKSRRVEGEETPNSIRCFTRLGALLVSQDRISEAEPFYREALEKRRRVLGEEHVDTLAAISALGNVLLIQGKYAEAEPYCREALEKRRRVLGEDHRDTLITLSNTARVLRAQGRHQEAIDLLAPAEPGARKAFTRNDAPLAAFLTTFGRARVGLGWGGDSERFTLAETNLLEAHPIFAATGGEKHKDTLDCVQGLIDLYTVWDKAEPGRGYNTKGAEWKAKLDAPASAPVKGLPQ